MNTDYETAYPEAQRLLFVLLLLFILLLLLFLSSAQPAENQRCNSQSFFLLLLFLWLLTLENRAKISCKLPLSSSRFCRFSALFCSFISCIFSKASSCCLRKASASRADLLSLRRIHITPPGDLTQRKRDEKMLIGTCMGSKELLRCLRSSKI